MTNRDQRLVIATLVGWTNCRVGSPGAGATVERPGRPVGTPPGRAYVAEVPNYTGSLDAARQAVLTWVGLPEDRESFHQSPEYLFDTQLTAIAEQQEVPTWQLGAPEWCEALLRAANKWVD